jgi:hypothetical protein
MLLAQCVDRRFARDLIGHEVTTVLLVVIAVIGILAGLLFPAFQAAMA